MPPQPAIHLQFEPGSYSKMRAFKGRFDFNQVCADNTPYIFTSSMQLTAQIVGIKNYKESGHNYNDFASFLASTTFHGNAVICPNKKSETALEAIWKQMKMCKWVQINPNTVVFDEEVETVEIAVVSTTTTSTSSNIVNKKRIATRDAGGIRKKRLAAFYEPQPAPQSKTLINLIHNG